MNSVELFAGAGGLAIGAYDAGFRHLAMVEWNQDACKTLRGNQQRGFHALSDCKIDEADVAKYDFSGIRPGIDLLAGGPPCQPFSLAGKHAGHKDERNMFPAMVRAVRELRPRAILVENVKGLTRLSFHNYFEYIKLQLSYPEVTRRKAERWTEHLARLEEIKTSGKVQGLHYNIVSRVLNASEFGVPQHRHRVFIVGFRSDLGVEWSFPELTHSLDALLHDQWISGKYWERHEVSKRNRPEPSTKFLLRITRLRNSPQPTQKPMLTVRDAIKDLPDPQACRDVSRIANHEYNPGARTYPGHTGSPLDEPAKTLKAGDHGVPGGENMLLTADGRVRYFTIRESARLQTFPDDYNFSGSWTEAMRQIGNAVPVRLANLIASNIRRRLVQNSRDE